MLASQLLYTSWKNGNSTTKGYMVYSKSKDITAVEETEICAVMKYKAPDNLPYTPSNEEIETLFPKIFAYFKLSSGRLCLAQSAYIGQDYTNRWGNYIIHAYVFDDIGDLVPSKMIGTDIFRTKLTEDELNADSAPEFLPRVDVENNGSALTEQEIKEFFGFSNRRETLKVLAQSVCDAILGNKRINLIDDLSNMRMWITALSMVLPKNILSQVYFSTYAIENSDLITLSCKQNSASSNTYAQSYLPNDLICIDVNQFNFDLTIGCYIDSVCNRLIDEYYDGILCANSVNKLMFEYECTDCDLAYKLTYVQKGELDYISSNDELLNIIGLLAKHEEENLSDVFGNIFTQYSSSEMYNGDASSIAVFKTLYPHISAESKADLLMMYVDRKLENNGDSSQTYAEIKRDCPCGWNEAVMHFLRQSFREHFGQQLSNAAALLLCNSWISIYQRCNDDQQQRAFEQISTLYARQVASRDTQAVLCVLDNCKCVDETLYSAVYKSVCKTMIDSFGEDDNYLFDYLKLSLDKGNLFWSVLLDALNRFPALEQKYIEHFIALHGEFSLQVANLMKYAEKNPPISQFVNSVKVYAFENSHTDSFESLIDCYTKYIANSTSGKEFTDKCRVVFAQKAHVFLKNCDGKDSIKYAMALYENLYLGKDFDEADKDMLSLLSETIYNGNQKNIAFISKCLSKTPFETVVAFMNSCQTAGLNIHPRALLMYEGHYFEKAAGKDGKSAKRVVQKMFAENRYMFLSKACTGNLLEEFLDSYMDVMLKGMYMIYSENENLNASDLIDYFLVPISKLYSRFGEDILKTWRADIGTTNENMDIYFLYIFEKTNVFRNELRDIIEEYLICIGKGKRNALFEKLTDYFADFDDVSYSKKMDRYIKEFNKNHVSFWDKVKSIFSVKEEDISNGKKK